MRRDDLRRILVLGSGPIVIGQACEFDYSGTQAVKALRQEGYEVVLVNSNPATIMTDPEVADRTYIEPVDPPTVEAIIERERPDALLPTLGGQTGLNVAVALADAGVLARHGVELIGARVETIRKAEDRGLFRDAMVRIGLEVPRSVIARSLAQAREGRGELGLPCVIRPAFTLGGTGGGIAYNVDEFDRIVEQGLDASMVHEVLVEESVIGWKEFELEVMRDRKDHCVIVCSIENVDPMGVHTGDSITVAPAQTLTDKEYQRMRDAAIAILREVGVDTGGSNVQFAVEPSTGRMVVIEMNPRVSRSSALASKATGFPIAKIAAKLAVGYTLDEIPNDITRETPASFEPSIDYVVVKAPRFAFEKFPEADATLTTSMKSVGETMAIGRSFQEALQKALRGLEVGLAGLEPPHGPLPPPSPTDQELRRRLFTPNADRLLAIRAALERGWEVRQVAELTRMDPWFLDQVADLVAFERQLASAGGLQAVPEGLLREAKRRGYSDVQLGRLWGASSDQVRDERARRGVVPTYKMVDTCAAEFEARTPYYYSTYESECEVRTDGGPHVVILGGGPNRIGQGIEFDYCCCQAAFALREAGYRAVMVNSNPETVSTDYDTSDLLFFEPLTHEDVVHVCERVRPVGVIVQFGGQTPLNLARGLQDAGLPIVGTSVDSIERAEDRGLFARLLEELDLRAPASGTALDADGARSVAARVGYPVMVRPSFVLGGRAMEICYDEAQLARYMDLASGVAPGRPILVDRFLDDAIEVDVDCVADGTEVVVGGILEHIEEAGIHSGDASCAIPPYTLDERSLAAIRRHTTALALALEVKGLMNVQFAVQDETVYVLEVNPRASRTVPFVSKAVGLDLARIATRVMMGRSLRSQGVREPRPPAHVAVKKSVFPFGRFPGVDILLGPEMRSTGEVMGLADDFPTAFAKAQAGASEGLPTRGAVLVTVRDDDKRDVLFVAHRLSALGFELVATRGTAAFLERHGVRPVRAVAKVHEGRPNPLDVIRNGEVALVINTPGGPETRADERRIRALAVERRVPCITTLSAAQVVVSGIEALRRGPLGVRPLQDYHAGDARDTTASRAPNPTPTRRARGVPS